MKFKTETIVSKIKQHYREMQASAELIAFLKIQRMRDEINNINCHVSWELILLTQIMRKGLKLNGGVQEGRGIS